MRCCFHSFKDLSGLSTAPFSIVNQRFISIRDAKVGGFHSHSKYFCSFREVFLILYRRLPSIWSPSVDYPAAAADRSYSHSMP